MFLTKKGFIKILIMAIAYFIVGSLSITAWVIFRSIGIPAKALLVLGIIIYLLCVIMIFWGRYAEGKGILINLVNKLVRNELKPMEFIKHYEELKNYTGEEVQQEVSTPVIESNPGDNRYVKPSIALLDINKNKNNKVNKSCQCGTCGI